MINPTYDGTLSIQLTTYKDAGASELAIRLNGDQYIRPGEAANLLGLGLWKLADGMPLTAEQKKAMIQDIADQGKENIR